MIPTWRRPGPGQRCARNGVNRDMATQSASAPRVRAPELKGRGWLNTGGRELHLVDLRGKVVLLDFWTFSKV